MSQNQRNKTPESQDVSFTVDNEQTGVGGMPSVSRLLDRRKLAEAVSKSAPTPPPRTPTPKGPEVPAYAPPPPGGELDLGLDLSEDPSAAALLELRPEQGKTEVVTPGRSGLGQVELDPNAVPDEGIQLDARPPSSTRDSIHVAPTEPAVEALPTVSVSDLPFDLPEQHTPTPDGSSLQKSAALFELGQAPSAEGASAPTSTVLAEPGALEMEPLGGGVDSPAPSAQASSEQTTDEVFGEIRAVKRRRGPDAGLAAEYRETSYMDLLSDTGGLTQALGVLFDQGATGALVLQDGGGEVVAALGIDGQHRGAVWRGLRWNPGTGGDLWAQLLRTQAVEIGPAAKLPEGAPTPVVTHIRSGFRTAMGADANETLTLFHIDLPAYGKGVLAVFSEASLTPSFTTVKPLLKSGGSALKAA